ncbi:MAG: pyridoxal-phosphate dependent enzyme [Proteobacteria bacterium]|jgi:cysteine synthase|nr:pyridoxal-phosphate dependent enzyme [Pseudomonadota bacterium]
MSRIIPRLDEKTIAKTAKRCKERGIRIPTFAELRDPSLIPKAVTARLPAVGLWDVDPINLYRITWKNDVATGLYGRVNRFEIPQALSGVRARIVGLVGKFFPTGAHKVGAAFGCLVPRLVSGAFDPTRDKAVWPSTGNFCRGGAFDCALLGCTAVAILPEEMSKERFDWLREIGAEVIATKGCESNVKEIYDKCWELRADAKNVIFNQFEEFGNPIFHYNVTGPAIEEAYDELATPRTRLAAYISATGSAGTIAAGDYLKKRHGGARTVASEALQCPTLLRNGFGGHRIEGIGDKHVPWVHNVRNTDAIAAIDDADCIRLMRLFNTPAGRDELARAGVDAAVVEQLPLLGISSIGNLLAAIKTAKHFELDEDDVVFTVFTDSMELYGSRLEEAERAGGEYTARDAAGDLQRALLGQGIDSFKELGYWDRKAIHNLKYFTWIEQQGRELAELNAQWSPEYWRAMFEDELPEFEALIQGFNALIDGM